MDQEKAAPDLTKRGSIRREDTQAIEQELLRNVRVSLEGVEGTLFTGAEEKALGVIPLRWRSKVRG